MTFSTLTEALDSQARLQPDAPAIIRADGVALTYAAVQERAQALAAIIASNGVGPGEVVASVVPSDVAAAVSFLGVSRWGAYAPLHPALTESELHGAFRRLKPRLVLAHAHAPSHVARAAKEVAARVLELPSWLESLTPIVAPPADEHGAVDDRQAVALILPTSGTTGDPKFVPLTHSNVLAAALASREAYRLTSQDTRINVMPLFHVQGLVGSLATVVVSGGAVVLFPRFDPLLLLTSLEAFAGTWFSASPAMHAEVLATTRRYRPRGSTLRFIRSGSAPLDEALRARIEASFAVPILNSYGMTEASQVACTPLDGADRKPGTLGRPTGSEVAVLDAGRVSAHGFGELTVRGANVAQGYLDDPAATAAAFIDGWFRTGDLGFVDRDGFIGISGRLRDVINRAGEKIAAREVDAALLSHPAVSDAAAFAVPHSVLGEDVAAAVVADAAVTADELREFLAVRLAPFKVPRRIFHVTELPRTRTGKIRRHLLRDLAQGATTQALEFESEVEREVARIWLEVLATDRVGPEDDFFALGGDSLLEARVRARIYARYGVDLPEDAFYREAATVRVISAALAEAMEQRARPGSG